MERQQQKDKKKEKINPVAHVNRQEKATQISTGHICASCGTVNELHAMFCEDCGMSLREAQCPQCGAPMDPNTDFCEACQTYVASDKCSFCNAPLSVDDIFCSECGSPRNGIMCTNCHTMGLFGFCAHCGTPLTDSARNESEKAWDVPFFKEFRALEAEIEKLWMTLPVTDTKEENRAARSSELRERVLKLLASENEWSLDTETIEMLPKSIKKDELEAMLAKKREELQCLLDKMEAPMMQNPAQARNYAMARKPRMSKLGWRCNYKYALHTSPLGCACPQMGGKWVVLDGQTENEIEDDK